MANTGKFPKYAAALITLANGLEQAGQIMKKAKQDAAEYDTAGQVSTYAEGYRKELKERVYSAAIEKVDALVIKLDKAYRTLLEGTEFVDMRLDMSNRAVRNALDAINALGKDVPFEVQTQIIDDARGDLKAMNFIYKLFKKNDLYFADAAKAATELVSPYELENIGFVLSKWRMFHEWDESKLFHAIPEIRRTMERLGVAGNIDPYAAAMRELGNRSQIDAERNAEYVRLFKQANDMMKKGGGDIEASGAIYEALMADREALSQRGNIV